MERVQQFPDASAVLGGEREQRLHPQLVEVPDQRIGFGGVDLVDRHEDGLVHAAQQIGDRPVHRRQALAPVHQEDERVGFVDRAARLLADQSQHPVLGGRHQAAGVDQLKPPSPVVALGVMPVARHAGKVLDDGLPPAQDTVEQRGLADVRAAYDGDGKHESEYHGAWSQNNGRRLGDLVIMGS